MRFLAIILVCSTTFCGMAAAQSEDSDRGYIQAFLEDNLSDAGRDVRITGFEGALSARATIQELTIADADGVWLTLKGAVLDWNRSALLSGRLEISELSATELLLPRRPNPAPASETVESGLQLPELPVAAAQPFVLPDLPVSIDVANVSIDRVSFGEPLSGLAAMVRLKGSADLNEGAGSASLTVERIDNVRGKLALNGSFSNATRLLDLSLSVSEAVDGIAANLIGLPGRPSVDLNIAGKGPISNFTADISLATDDTERVAGDLTLQTPGVEVDNPGQQFAMDLGGDIRPLVPVQYRAFLGPDARLGLRGTKPSDGGLALHEMTVQTDTMVLAGQLDLGSDYWPARFDLSGEITSDNGEDVLLALPGPETWVSSAAFHAGYDAADADDWTLNATLTGLRREAMSLTSVRLKGSGQLTQGDDISIARVLGSVRMELDGIALADAALATAVGPSLRGKVAFDLRQGAPLVLSEVALTGIDYSMTGQLDARGLLDDLNVSVAGEVNLSANNLEHFSGISGQALSGRAALTIAGTSTPLDGAFDLDISGSTHDLGVDVGILDPLIAGPGQLNMTVKRSVDGTEINRLTIRTPQADLTANAHLAAGDSSGSIDLRVKDTSLIEPKLTGPARLGGTFLQAGQNWEIDLAAEAPGAARVALNGNATIDNGILTLIAGSLGIQAKDIAPYSGLAGTSLSGALDISANGEANLATGEFAGSLNGTTENLTTGVSELDLLLAGVSNVTSVLRRDTNGILVLDQFDVTTPQLHADLTGSHSPSRSRVRFNLDLRDIALYVSDFSGPVAARGVVSSSGDHWDVKSTMSGPGGTTAAVEGTIERDVDGADLVVSGMGPLALINRFISPNLATGMAVFNLALNGPFDKNSISGSVRTDGASLSLPNQQLALGDIAADAQVGAGQARIDAGANVSSGGRLSLSGSVSLQTPFRSGLDITLTNVSVEDPGIYQTTVDGGINVNGALAGGAVINGALALGPVEIRVPDGTGAANGTIPGLIHRNEPRTVRLTRSRAGFIDRGNAGTSGRPYPLDLTITAPARVFIRGRGLDAEMGGALRLRGTTADVIPEGRFDLIRGRLDILGKRLDLTEGFAQLQGDFDAYLRIVAETQNDGTTIRFVIEGLASEPTLTITSSPQLPEDEVLSRLLFGRDVTQISALQALQLAAAVNTLAGGGGGGIVNRLRENFGLDDLDVSTSETGETDVRVGKYITDNIYSDVTVDSTGKSEINLNLSITPSVTVRGSLGSDGNSGVGVFYEKDY